MIDAVEPGGGKWAPSPARLGQKLLTPRAGELSPGLLSTPSMTRSGLLDEVMGVIPFYGFGFKDVVCLKPGEKS